MINFIQAQTLNLKGIIYLQQNTYVYAANINTHALSLSGPGKLVRIITSEDTPIPQGFSCVMLIPELADISTLSTSLFAKFISKKKPLTSLLKKTARNRAASSAEVPRLLSAKKSAHVIAKKSPLSFSPSLDLAAPKSGGSPLKKMASAAKAQLPSLQRQRSVSQAPQILHPDSTEPEENTLPIADIIEQAAYLTSKLPGKNKLPVNLKHDHSICHMGSTRIPIPQEKNKGFWSVRYLLASRSFPRDKKNISLLANDIRFQGSNIYALSTSVEWVAAEMLFCEYEISRFGEDWHLLADKATLAAGNSIKMLGGLVAAFHGISMIADEITLDSITFSTRLFDIKMATSSKEDQAYILEWIFDTWLRENFSSFCT